jgi:hypothetical protein
LNIAPVYHGGNQGGKTPFSVFGGGGGSGGGNQWVSLPFTATEEIDTGVTIPAPTVNFVDLNDVRHGYFFEEDHILRELHLLFNRFMTTGSGQTSTIQFRQLLADGSLPPSSIFYTHVTTFPDTSFAWWYYFGDQNLNMNIIIPAGYEMYCRCSGKTTFDTEGLSVVALLEKVV